MAEENKTDYCLVRNPSIWGLGKTYLAVIEKGNKRPNFIKTKESLLIKVGFFPSDGQDDFEVFTDDVVNLLNYDTLVCSSSKNIKEIFDFIKKYPNINNYFEELKQDVKQENARCYAGCRDLMRTIEDL